MNARTRTTTLIPLPLPRTPAINAEGVASDFAAAAWIQEFVDLSQQAIAEVDDEDMRRHYEDELLRRVPYLRAAGVFEVFQVAHPALRAMIEDHARG